MKVTLEKDYRDMYTLSALESAKKVIKACKEDTNTPKVYAMMAADCILKMSVKDYPTEILKATATTCLNPRIRDRYDEGSGRMDVWIDAIVKTAYGFIDLGVYLTDLWDLPASDADEEAARNLVNNGTYEYYGPTDLT